MTFSKPLILLIAALTFLVAVSPFAQAQKVDRKYFELPEFGFRFKPLKDFKRIPPQERDKSFGIIGKMEGKELFMPIKGQGVHGMNAEIQVYRFVDRKLASVTVDGVEVDEITSDKEGLADYLGPLLQGSEQEGLAGRRNRQDQQKADRAPSALAWNGGYG